MTLQRQPLYLDEAVYMAPKSWIDSTSAGVIIRAARERLSMTQDQVAESLDVDKSYISKLESGLHHPGRSKYFPQLVEVLRLTSADVRQLNPGAVVDVVHEDPSILTTPRRALPEELEDMIRMRRDDNPELNDARWQQYLAGQRFSTGSVSAERWWRLYLLLKAEGIEPGGH